MIKLCIIAVCLSIALCNSESSRDNTQPVVDPSNDSKQPVLESLERNRQPVYRSPRNSSRQLRIQRYPSAARQNRRLAFPSNDPEAELISSPVNSHRPQNDQQRLIRAMQPEMYAQTAPGASRQTKITEPTFYHHMPQGPNDPSRSTQPKPLQQSAPATALSDQQRQIRAMQASPYPANTILPTPVHAQPFHPAGLFHKVSEVQASAGSYSPVPSGLISSTLFVAIAVVVVLFIAKIMALKTSPIATYKSKATGRSLDIDSDEPSLQDTLLQTVMKALENFSDSTNETKEIREKND